ncbi:MAG TPA: FAD-dependent oxidoreductase [Solirubrobacterales bacterium]|nr:FAD-dependent oxidoreductase [Solirubrobacterales bacterium]
MTTTDAETISPDMPETRVSLDAFRRAAGLDGEETQLGRVFAEPPGGWSEEADVVVVGSGAAAYAAACAAADAGGEVIVAEKGAVYGGTSIMSGGVLHVFANPRMRDGGVDDPREDALRYLARCCYPSLYRSEAPRFGVGPAEFELLETYYDRGVGVLDSLREMGAVDVRAPFVGWDGTEAPDYLAHYPENAVPRGRGLSAVKEDGTAGTGKDLVLQMKAFADAKGARLLLRHRAVGLVMAEPGRVDGLVCRTPEGLVSLRARSGVVFGTGGITHSAQLRTRFLRGPVAGGAGCATNTGDLIAIAEAAGAEFGLVSSGFWNQQVADFADDLAPTNLNVWYVPGDGVVVVNRFGRRVVNEKADYHNRGRAHHVWQGDEYPNQILFMVYDERTAERFAGAFPVPPTGTAGAHVVHGATPAELQAGLERHLRKLGRSPALPVPDVKLDEAFAAELEATIERFNGFARSGDDADFGRGDHPIDRWAHGPPAADNDLPNATMYPLSTEGPYSAIVLVGSAFEAKAGPRINSAAQVMAPSGDPIAGLYGAGNCIAGVLGESYTGGGASLGPAVVFGFIAGRHAVEEGSR